MNAEIITIGDEILLGQTIDSNSAYIASRLDEIGIPVHFITSIHDTATAITDSLKAGMQRSDLIIFTGGLGPTNDDITKKTLASFFNQDLKLNKRVLEHIKNLFDLRGQEVSPTNILQAHVPVNAKILHNSNGTAPGMWFEENGTIVISLPGVPYELKDIIDEEVIPGLLNKVKKVLFHKMVLFQGIAESHLAEKLESWEAALPGELKVAYLPEPGKIKLRLSLQCKDPGQAGQKFDEAILALKKLVGDYIYGFDNDQLEALVGDLLLEKGKTLATAESCTAGSIGRAIVSVPGSSRYYVGGVIAYSNSLKTSLLNVDNGLVMKHGAVSEEVVKAMLEGVLRNTGADYGIATSGIAGPGGGTIEKPVGTTWIAVGNHEKIDARKYMLGKHRGRVIDKTTITALNMLRLFLA